MYTEQTYTQIIPHAQRLTANVLRISRWPCRGFSITSNPATSKFTLAPLNSPFTGPKAELGSWKSEALERRTASSKRSAAGPLLFVARAEGGGGLHC